MKKFLSLSILQLTSTNISEQRFSSSGREDVDVRMLGKGK
jgi:tRNA U54 and U55 pseudouridine synthase Pus10